MSPLGYPIAENADGSHERSQGGGGPGLDCFLDKPWKHSKAARPKEERLTNDMLMEKMKYAYTLPSPKYVPGANSLVNQMLAKKKKKASGIKGSSRASSAGQGDKGSVFAAGGSFLEAAESASVSTWPSALTLPTHPLGGGNSVHSISTVGSIIHDYKNALEMARSQDEVHSSLLSPVQTGAASQMHASRSGGASRARQHRPRTATPALFACRYEGCGKHFTIAKDLFIHECQAHSDIHPRNIFIPLDSTLSADAKRASTANTMRLPPSRKGCTGLNPPVPICRPQSAVSVDVLQQRRKWEDLQQLSEWALHRQILDEYTKKLDIELGKTRPRLPMGPLAQRAKLAALLDD